MANKYALDTNILVVCHRNFYPFDIAPGFWRQLLEKSSQRIVLLDRVKNEIYRNEDELSRWLKTNENLFEIKKSGNENIRLNYTKIITSVELNKQYKKSAKFEFASVADSWICALAMTYGYVVVTQETYEPNIKKKVKISNVCEEFNIAYINLMRFIREMGIRFD